MELAETAKKFVLIDGNAILHRAYHALPPLTNSKGVVANAAYGFFSMFLKILEDLKPQYIAVCFDRPKPTFRQELYAGYQQKRPAMADDLVPQIGMVHKVLEKMNVQIFEIDGYEADDLIGTLATQVVQLSVLGSQFSDKSQSDDQSISLKNRKTEKPRDQHLKTENRKPITEVIIVSGDRDMLQLVNGHVKVLMPVTGLSNTILHDSESVKKKYGVKPSQFIDYKALVGDASDGYPGVAGIGPKTAAELLTKHGTFEHMFTHLSDLPEKIAEKMAKDAEQAALAKKLATIVTDAPVSFDSEKCNISHFSKEGTREALEELGFKSLLKRYFENGSASSAAVRQPQLKQNKNNKNKQLGLL